MPRPPRALTPELSPAHRFGAQLRAYREKKDWSQLQVAAAVHISTSLVSMMEKGERISTLEVATACDETLGAGGELAHLWAIAAASRVKNARPGRGAARSPRPVEGPVDGMWASFQAAVDHVERMMGVRLDPASAVRGSSAVGARTDRGTWVRIDRYQDADLSMRGGDGGGAAPGLRGVNAPVWLGAMSWRDRDPVTVWHAEETGLAQHPLVDPGGTVRSHPQLPDRWWRTWCSSLEAISDHRSARFAVANGEPVDEDHVARVIGSVWPNVAHLRVDEWRVAHGAMDWAHVTKPVCMILGWRNWGRAPRGLDAATLWSRSLLVPSLARRIWSERRADLESPTGIVAALYALASVLTDPHLDAGALAGPARAAAAHLAFSTAA